MKFLVFPFFTLFLASTSKSQVAFNFFAGPQATSAKYSANSVKQPTKLKYGFQAGLGLRVPFDKKLYFAPALFYSMKGYKVTFNQFLNLPDITATDNNTTLHTVETAFLLQYYFTDQPNHAFLKSGPSLDFQLSGHEKFNTTANSSVSRKMKFSYGDYGHYAANWLVQAGYETGTGFIIFAQYSHGLASINNADDGPAIRHRAFGISVGKYFK